MEVKRYDQLFPYLKSGSLLSDDASEPYALYIRESCSDRFMPEHCLTCIDETHMGISSEKEPFSVSVQPKDR